MAYNEKLTPLTREILSETHEKTMAIKEGKDFIYNWARSISDKEVSFVEVKD